MVKASELKRWLDTLGPDAFVAVDEGGLELVEVGSRAGAYLEVGGVPEEEEDEEYVFQPAEAEVGGKRYELFRPVQSPDGNPPGCNACAAGDDRALCRAFPEGCAHDFALAWREAAPEEKEGA
jgi:hypothetical protein